MSALNTTAKLERVKAALEPFKPGGIIPADLHLDRVHLTIAQNYALCAALATLDELLAEVRVLQAENERLKQNHGCARGQRTTQWCGEAAETHAKLRELMAVLEAVKGHAIAQDCGRLCDSNPKLVYREQWKRSEEYVEGLIRHALSPAKPQQKEPIA